MEDPFPTGHVDQAIPNKSGIDYPLLLTKLYAPQLPTGLVPRPGHLQLLDRALDHKVTLVSTPPGYGKSTLVSQWLATTRHPSAWLSLDDADNDSATFMRYLLAAIDGIDDSLTSETRRLLREQRGVPVHAIVDTLLTGLASATRPFILVFDDFHVIQSPELLQGMGRLLTYAPPALRVVLISRSDPSLSLMRMRARGELLELRASDLMFSLAEARDLLRNGFALPVDDAQLASLHAWSEGWPLGLMLVGKALQQRAHDQIDTIIERFERNPDFIADYLWHELMLRQPEDRQLFLLRTSILGQFNADVCNVVTGGTDAEAMLHAVAGENLFLIPLGERRFWYRYHHLFQDVLRERLVTTRSDDEVRALHTRASHWYRSQGLVEEAATHAIKGQDWELALEILTPLCHELYRDERLARIYAWLNALPDEIIERDPQLSYEFAWSLTRVGYAAQSRSFMNAAEKHWQAAGDNVGIARILGIRALDDFFSHSNNQGIERCQQSLALLPEANVDDRARIYSVLSNLLIQAGEVAAAEEALLQCRMLAREMGSAPLQLIELNTFALCLFARGELLEAETVFQRATVIGDEWHDIPVVYTHFLLGSIYLDQYRFELAEQMLERALELADRLSARTHRLGIYRLLAELAWARQDSEAAMAGIERAIAASGPGGFRMEERSARALRAQFWMRQGKYNLVRGWAAELDLTFGEPPEYRHVDEFLVALELLARDGNSKRAHAWLDVAIEHASAKHQIHSLLRMLVLKSLISKLQGKLADSLAALSSALDIGSANGYVRPFLAYGSELDDQLHALSATSSQTRFIRHLLEQARLGRQRNTAPEEFSNPLSARQTEIMRLVAAGYSNRDIADRLFISEQTVKKHLSTTFTRLDVSSRTQAIEASRRLGIL